MSKVEVYHLTSPDITQKIAVEGLKPRLYLNQEPEVRALENIFESLAPEGFSRQFATFAFPERHMAMWHTWILGQGAVIAYVDPRAVFVADFEVYSEAHYAFKAGSVDRARSQAEIYWAGAMSLEDYFRLPKSQRTTYNYWEVIIPNGVEAHNLSIELLPRTKVI